MYYIIRDVKEEKYYLIKKEGVSTEKGCFDGVIAVFSDYQYADLVKEHLNKV